MEKDSDNLDHLDLIDENFDLIWSSLDVPSIFDPTSQMVPFDLDNNSSVQTSTYGSECDSTTSTSPQQPESTLDITYGTTPVHGIPNIEGVHGFRVTLPKEGENGNSANWTYSETLDELFVKMDRDCPFQINAKGISFPPSATIRVRPFYRRAADQSEQPVRCLNHLAPQHETNRDHQATEHLIRSYMPNAIHTKDSTSGSTSLCFPCQINASDSMSCILRFMCRTSCPGGMNRRPFCVVFSLEDNGVSLAQQVKKVHVCACPRRDCKNEESRMTRLLSRYGDRTGNVATDFQFGTNDHMNNEQSHGYRQRNMKRPQEPNMVQDLKRACKRYASKLEEDEKPTKKQKVYTIRVSSEKIYNILRALVPIIEATIRKQDNASTESDS